MINHTYYNLKAKPNFANSRTMHASRQAFRASSRLLEKQPPPASRCAINH